MTEATRETSYEAHAAEPEYVDMNRAFVGSIDLEGVGRLLDLACGTGLMAQLALERRPGIEVVALDLTRRQLELTRERFRGDGSTSGGTAQGPRALLLVEGSADVLPFAAASMDAVILGNSIHNIPDRDRLLSEVNRVLREGGHFAFNSVFYAGNYAGGTEKFHQAWIQGALRYVMRRDRELKAQGLPGVPRKRGTVKPAFSRRWLSPGEWKDALAQHGLVVTGCHERLMEMTRSNYETIGAYEGFASVLLSGYPIALACEALPATVGEALEATGFTTVPQNWLEMKAVKRVATAPGGNA